SGRIEIVAVGSIANGTAADGATLRLRYGLGTPPANGAAGIGNTLGTAAILTNNANTAAAAVPFTLNGFILNATPGVPLWVDISLAANTGGTATISNVGMFAFEN